MPARFLPLFNIFTVFSLAVMEPPVKSESIPIAAASSIAETSIFTPARAMSNISLFGTFMSVSTSIRSVVGTSGSLFFIIT